jgi:hypothetical protein
MDNGAHNDNSDRRDHDRLTVERGMRAVLGLVRTPRVVG